GAGGVGPNAGHLELRGADQERRSHERKAVPDLQPQRPAGEVRRSGETDPALPMTTILKASVFICVCLWPALGAVDYSKFSHSTPKHKGSCDTCHKAPT